MPPQQCSRSFFIKSLYNTTVFCKFFCKYAIYACIIPGVLLSCVALSKMTREVQQMAKCEYCGKGVSFGIKVSHSHRRSNRMWKPNVKRIAAVVDGTPRHVHVCTRCLRSGRVTRSV